MIYADRHADRTTLAFVAALSKHRGRRHVHDADVRVRLAGPPLSIHCHSLGAAMINRYLHLGLLGFLLGANASLTLAQEASAAASEAVAAEYQSTDLEFKGHDGVDLFGRLVLPKDRKPRAIVVYVQTAEGATIDQKRPLGEGKTFNYFDVYRDELTRMGVGFFSYEGRGIRMGEAPPRYEAIDREAYNTSTLDNKVQDVLSALKAIRGRADLSKTPIFLMGASEGTLIAVEAAAQEGAAVDGLVLYGVMASNLRKTFAYILTDGDFMRYRPIDKDGNGSISKEEWDSVIKHTGINQVDQNGDGAVTIDDVRIMNKALIDAVDNDGFEVLQAWAVNGAALSVPNNWFRDHFAHAEMWSFLNGLDIPVGIFHGDADRMAPLAAVKALEADVKEAGLSKVECHYFEGLDHSLGIGLYFVKGEMPAGHQAIFEFIDRIAPKE
jgi:alpha-beta hydrolase superfamily lysophospholipase